MARQPDERAGRTAAAALIEASNVAAPPIINDETVPGSMFAWRARHWRTSASDDLAIIETVMQTAPIHAGPDLSNIEIMTILLEDRRFFLHNGIDLQSIVREALRALSQRRAGGASTIDMQLVRTITGYRERTLSRKFYEITLARHLARRYSKLAILRSYLAIAYFGVGLIGAEAAVQAIYSKSAQDLDLSEAAFVSAMLCRPRPANATSAWIERVSRRAQYGLRIYAARQRRGPLSVVAR